jgi:hypothetical protein
MNLFSTHPPLEERIARLRGVYGKGNNSGISRDMESQARDAWDRLSK